MFRIYFIRLSSCLYVQYVEVAEVLLHWDFMTCSNSFTLIHITEGDDHTGYRIGTR